MPVQQINNRTVHLDVELEVRDLFRASLDIAKYRLLAAVAIFAVLFAGLAYFFSIIDEKKIGLELSPLFVGCPLIAIVGQILRLRVACKKSLSDKTTVQYMFQEQSDGYDLNWGNSFAHVSWENVLKIVEKPHYFRMDLDKVSAALIPKRAFHQASDMVVFRDIVRSRLKHKAQLFAEPAGSIAAAY